MKERPIIFSGPMVRAILKETKTETRRIIKPQPSSTHWEKNTGYKLYQDMLEIAGGDYALRHMHTIMGNWADPEWRLCPYGRPGDRLYVREAHAIDGDEAIYYRATDHESCGPWRPSIHMFKRHSRIWLEVTDIKVERLQDITNNGAWCEGVSDSPEYNCIEKFRVLWNTINGPDAWDRNPWVWVVKFKRVASVSTD